MNREHEPNGAPPPDHESDAPSDADDSQPAMRALLKRSLSVDEQPPSEGAVLRGVQRRIRVRSRGKFYADGWSTSTSRIHYALVAAVMLVLIAIAYFALGPMGMSR
jgi:hypothetical protein